jgi:hypothetical protein
MLSTSAFARNTLTHFVILAFIFAHFHTIHTCHTIHLFGVQPNTFEHNEGFSRISQGGRGGECVRVHQNLRSKQ